MILAIDPATKCGWCLGETAVIAAGTWDLSIRRDESSGMRLVRLRAKLEEILSGQQLSLVVYEGARHANPKMQGALVVTSELVAVIKLWCTDNWVEYRAYSPSEIKTHATGSGNANKEKMMAAAVLKWHGLLIVDDNHADALWLWDLARKQYAGAF